VLPSGYDEQRRIGWIYIESDKGDPSVLPFFQEKDASNDRWMWYAQEQFPLIDGSSTTEIETGLDGSGADAFETVPPTATEYDMVASLANPTGLSVALMQVRPVTISPHPEFDSWLMNAASDGSTARTSVQYLRMPVGNVGVLTYSVSNAALGATIGIRGYRDSLQLSPAHPPLPVTSGLASRWRAYGGAVTLATGISAWDDAEGGHDWAQAVGASQPTYSTTLMKGRDTVRAGVDQGMTTPSHADFDIGTDAFLMVVALRRPQVGAVERVLFAIDNTADVGRLRFLNDAPQWMYSAAGYPAGATIPDDVPCFLAIGYDTFDGEAIRQVNATRARTTTAVQDSGSSGVVGLHDHSAASADDDVQTYAEILLFKRGANGAFSDAELDALYAYVRRYYL
jgi:hypothetical protein